MLQVLVDASGHQLLWSHHLRRAAVNGVINLRTVHKGGWPVDSGLVPCPRQPWTYPVPRSSQVLGSPPVQPQCSPNAGCANELVLQCRRC